MKLKIKDCVNVLGRGTIVVVDLPDKLLECVGDFTYVSKVHVGDKIKIESKEYIIKGVERFSTSKSAGLLLGLCEEDVDYFKGKELEI